MRDRISAATSAIRSLSSRRSEAKRARDFLDRAEALRTPAEQLGRLCRKLRLLQSYSVAVPLRPDVPLSLLGQVADIHQRFEENPESILTGDPKRAATFWRPLDGYAEQVENDLKQGWSTWVFQALPGGEPDLLNVLDRFESFREPVRVIRAAIAEANRLSAHLPESKGPLEAVGGLAESMRMGWERLNGAHVSPEVLSFLKKTAAREATLADYAPDVMRWVQENDLLRSFQISVGGK